MHIIREKIDSHPDSVDISNMMNKIFKCIDYEIDKFRDNRASVIFTGNLHPNTLFTMASHVKYSDYTQGIQNIKPQLEYINSKYNLDLENQVCKVFYDKFSAVAKVFLENVHNDYANTLKEIIVNREKYDDTHLLLLMQKLVFELDEINNQELINMMKIILQVDPLYKPLLENNKSIHLLHDHYVKKNIDTNELSFDFVDYAIKFIFKIYNQAFGSKKSNEKDDENNFTLKK